MCLERRIAIELDGGQHSEQEGYDQRRTKFLTAEGFEVLRFWNPIVFQETDAVLSTILDALEEG